MIARVSKDTLGDRLKRYESCAELLLPRKLPVFLRLDGNSFSELTKKLSLMKPFDGRMSDAMDAAAKAVVERCSGAVLAYTQSDEITILLQNDRTVQTEPFLGNRTQKIASLVAACCSNAFNRGMQAQGFDTQAEFDCRVFTVPHSDIVNVFLWRQRDAFRNCVSSVTYWTLAEQYGRKTVRRMLHGKSSKEQQELLFQECSVNVDSLPTEWKRGRCLYRDTFEKSLSDVLTQDKIEKLSRLGKFDPTKVVTRSEVVVDKEIPLFNQQPSYILNRYYGKEEEAIAHV